MPFRRRYIPKPTIKRLKRSFDRENVECSRIILADPAKYPGIMQECARKWSEQAGPVEHSEDSKFPLLAGLVA
jgi:hypothetical protein